mgnify:CR=1 FL=1
MLGDFYINLKENYFSCHGYLTNKKQKPRPEWFNYVITGKARAGIRKKLNEEEKEFLTEIMQKEKRTEEDFSEVLDLINNLQN